MSKIEELKQTTDISKPELSTPSTMRTTGTKDWDKTEFFISDTMQQQAKLIYQEGWDWWQFIIFFALHAVYFMMLGPAIGILLSMSERGLNVYYNLGFNLQKSSVQLQQLSFFVGFQISVWLAIFGDLTYFVPFDLYYLAAQLIIRSMVIGGKYATLSSHRIDRIYNSRIDRDVLGEDNFSAWIKPSNRLFVIEVTKSLLRENVDLAMFNLTFYFPLDTATMTQILNDEKEIKVNYDALCSEFTAGFELPPLLLHGSSSKHRYYGHSIIYELYRQFAAKISQSEFFWWAVIVNWLRFFIIFGISLSEGKYITGSAQDYIYLICVVYINIWMGTINIFLFLVGIKELETRDFMLTQAGLTLMLTIGYLILIQKSLLQSYRYPKLLQTLDILNSGTLRAWAALRIMMMDIGYAYTLRYQGMLSWFFIWGIVQVVLLFLNVFKVVPLETYATLMNIYDVVVLVIVIYIVLYLVARINDQYGHHKVLIQYQISILQNFQASPHIYFDKNYFTNNQVYMELRNRLQLMVDNQEQIPEFIDQLIETLESLMDSLEVYNESKPYTLLGIKIDSNVLISMQVGILGALLPAIYTLINEQLGGKLPS